MSKEILNEVLLFEGKNFVLAKELNSDGESFYVVFRRELAPNGTLALTRAELVGGTNGTLMPETLGTPSARLFYEIIETLLDSPIVKTAFLFCLLVVSQGASAGGWLCTEEASIRRGESIYACGIGQADNEADARAFAFEDAKREFERVCAASKDCDIRRTLVEPRRTECVAGDVHKCYRLVVFTAARAPDKVGRSLSILSKGMRQQEATSLLGDPYTVAHQWDIAGGTLFLYHGHPKCSLFECGIVFGKSGRVKSWFGVKPIFTNDAR